MCIVYMSKQNFLAVRIALLGSISFNNLICDPQRTNLILYIGIANIKVILDTGFEARYPDFEKPYPDIWSDTGYLVFQ